MRSRISLAVALSLTLCAAAVADSRVSLSDPGFVTTASALQVGERLRVDGVVLPGTLGSTALEVKRFEIFSPDVKIVVNGPEGETLLPRPRNRYFRGYIDGSPNSIAYFSIREDGELRGILHDAGRYWLLGNVRGDERLSIPAIREVPNEALEAGQRDATCSTGNLMFEPGQALRGMIPPQIPRPVGPAPTYTARVAVETDNEYLTLFAGNTTDATDYIGDIMAFTSGIYASEVDTDFFVSHISLWAGADPWEEFSTTCGLFEFGRYWNDNYGGMAGGDVYTISHFMSGKNNGGGVAWVGVLCSGGFNYNHQGACSLMPQTDNYGGPYGYSGTLDGDFDIDNPDVVWDIYVVAHEIGHNFDSPHTHCYNGVQGNPNPIDMCYGQQQGCYSGPTSLPSGCPGAGQGCGTIMSYCHLQGGGVANIALTLGTGHPYGVEPERVPAQITDHVIATAGGSPACLAPVSTVFTDGFESGDTSQWDTTVP